MEEATLTDFDYYCLSIKFECQQEYQEHQTRAFYLRTKVLYLQEAGYLAETKCIPCFAFLSRLAQLLLT